MAVAVVVIFVSAVAASQFAVAESQFVGYAAAIQLAFVSEV